MNESERPTGNKGKVIKLSSELLERIYTEIIKLQAWNWYYRYYLFEPDKAMNSMRIGVYKRVPPIIFFDIIHEKVTN